VKDLAAFSKGSLFMGYSRRLTLTDSARNAYSLSNKKLQISEIKVTIPRKSRQSLEIRNFILRSIPDHPVAIGALAAEKFDISRTSANRYLKRLEGEGLIEASGQTSARTYVLKEMVDYTAVVPIAVDASEGNIWRREMETHTSGLPDNVVRICYYGFTEMVNNVIDHSGSEAAILQIKRNYKRVELMVADHGIGIFEKIKSDFSLDDPRTALLELSKGKLTSDSKHHSGEGIFFTSLMFNKFSISSGRIYYGKQKTEDWGWLFESKETEKDTEGTAIFMSIDTDANWTTKEVFDKFQNDDMNFTKTHVPISLGKYGNEHLISRSQAKRILARFEKFEEVFLDFEGITEIGQAFADEIFRVFANEKPQIKIFAINLNDDVRGMINHAVSTDLSFSGSRPSNIFY
jgi:DNA-binding MarR family transcriptional regulator/anti-sigma regulatory factor (Ser/Thr protein kinase)